MFFFFSERISSKVVTCDKCNIQLHQDSYQFHLRTNIHKRNCILKTELEIENVDIIATAFKNRIVTYKVNPRNEKNSFTPEEFLCDIKEVVMQLITPSLEKHVSIKVNFELFLNVVLPKTDSLQLKSFVCKYEAVFRNTDLNEMYTKFIHNLQQRLIEFEHCESGWTFQSLGH